jgi:hypothetical protein
MTTVVYQQDTRPPDDISHELPPPRSGSTIVCLEVTPVRDDGDWIDSEKLSSKVAKLLSECDMVLGVTWARECAQAVLHIEGDVSLAVQDVLARTIGGHFDGLGAEILYYSSPREWDFFIAR